MLFNACIVLILSSSTSSWRQLIFHFIGFLYTNHGVLQTHNYNSQIKAKVWRFGTKSPTKANTDHHNGYIKW